MVTVITGGGSGIGAALAVKFAKEGLKVIIAGRRLEKLQEVASKNNNISYVQADVTTDGGIKSIVDKVTEIGAPLDYLIHNAGDLGPIGPLISVDHDQWKKLFDLNVHAPLFLTQALKSHMKSGSRVLNIGSGAASHVIDYWGPYCVTKSAFLMLSRVFASELKSEGIYFGSVRPGTVDTPMQAYIRGENGGKDFPAKDTFVGLYEKRLDNMKSHRKEVAVSPPAGALDSPENVAIFIHFLMTKVSAEEYTSEEWDIRDPKHHNRWTE